MARGIGGKTTRDMVLSLLPLVALILLFAGVVGMCSFSPGGPSTDPGAAPTVDASAELTRAAREVGFAVREPRLPDDWRANSFALQEVDARARTRAVRTGWLVPGGYLRLSQSDADEPSLVEFETRVDRPAAQGVVDVSGVSWVRYPSVRDESAWVADLDGVRLLVTGSATEDEFRALATAVLAAEPLPTR
ncbi:MAG TPA: DUF4245 domain-containing protein [Pseudonocardiaceae bacterium]